MDWPIASSSLVAKIRHLKIIQAPETVLFVCSVTLLHIGIVLKTNSEQAEDWLGLVKKHRRGLKSDQTTVLVPGGCLS